MSNYELLTVILMIFGIIVSILIAYINQSKKERNRERFYRQHQNEIEKHEAAKAVFEALNWKKISKVAELSKEYAMLLEEKKKNITPESGK